MVRPRWLYSQLGIFLFERKNEFKLKQKSTQVDTLDVLVFLHVVFYRNVCPLLLIVFYCFGNLSLCATRLFKAETRIHPVWPLCRGVVVVVAVVSTF